MLEDSLTIEYNERALVGNFRKSRGRGPLATAYTGSGNIHEQAIFTKICCSTVISCHVIYCLAKSFFFLLNNPL